MVAVPFLLVLVFLRSGQSLLLPWAIYRHQLEQHAKTDRRSWLQLISTTTATAAAVSLTYVPVAVAEEFATAAGRRGCETQSDPGKTVVTCTGELYRNNGDGRLSSIASTANGVSTAAVKNPRAYAVPWSYLPETSDPVRAWQSLVAAVQSVRGATVVTLSDTYLHATVTTSSGAAIGGTSIDDVEFLLKPEDNLVLFRSASRTSVFVYPLTQPLSDGGANRRRLDSIRQMLGWQEMN